MTQNEHFPNIGMPYTVEKHFGPPKGGPMISGLLVSQSVSQLVTRFQENHSKKFFEIWHEGRGLLVGKSDVGGFFSETRIFPKFGI